MAVAGRGLADPLSAPKWRERNGLIRVTGNGGPLTVDRKLLFAVT